MPIQSKSLGETGVAVAAGDVITLNAWANTVQSVRAAMNFRPASGDSPIPYVIDLTTTSARALATASVTVLEDGVIDAGSVFLPGLPSVQRGSVYVQLVNLSRGIVFAADYVFTGYAVPMGRVTPPGPAGGSGSIVLSTTPDPAAGTELIDTGPGTGQLWLLRLVTVQLVQGLTQTPLPSLEFENNANLQIAVIPAMTTALGASTTAQLTWGLGLVQESFVAVAGDEIYTAPLPIMYMGTGPAANLVSVFATLTDGIGANTNYGPATYIYEEWVMPN